jgi:uncharacterized protein
MDTTELAERLRVVLEEGPALRLALLFGSGARGTLRRDSDVDVAILVREPAMTLGEGLALQACLSRAVGREVDLVRLDRANPLLRWRIAREGVALLANPPFELPRFRAQAAIEHADMLPQLRHAQEIVRRRLAEGAKAKPGAEA